MDSIIEDAYRTGSQELRNLATELQEFDLRNEIRRQELFWNLAAAADKIRHPPMAFSPILTVVNVAPDEDSQLQAVMVRLAKRGNYDSLSADLVIATLGPHDTQAIINYLDSLAVGKIEHTTTPDGKKLAQCVVCEDRLPAKDVVLAYCGHCYCGPCLRIMFNTAISDESCYPPRCCANTPIPIEHAKRFLTPSIEGAFKEKGVEFATVNRTYCSNPGCSVFIPPGEIEGDTATCSLCSEETCVTCKAPAHRGDCPADLELASLLELAREMRWQRCYNCLSIVQKDDGCHHMECRCGVNFCYLCGGPLMSEQDDEPLAGCLCSNEDIPLYRLYQPSDHDDDDSDDYDDDYELEDEYGYSYNDLQIIAASVY